MKRIAVASLLLLALVACGREKPKLAEPDTGSTSVPAATFETTPTTTAQSTTSTVKDAMTTSKNGGGDPYAAMVPPDGVTPAAGSCSNAASGVAFITLNPDVPSPRCIIVHDSDRLKIKNNMGVRVTVDDGGNGFVFTVDNGATEEQAKAVGCCWQPGVHRLRVSNTDTTAKLYGGSGPEVWLQR